MCLLVNVLWSDDKDSNFAKVWVKCDNCPITMHFQCIPSAHTDKLDINMLNVDESDFVCEACILKSIYMLICAT